MYVYNFCTANPTMALHSLSALIFSLLVVSSISAGDDAAVMRELASSLYPVPSGWTGSDYCSWSNINCDGSNRVTSINLASMSLSGSLPSDLNRLSQLILLSLRGNSLSGPLPSLSNLSSLQEIYLDRNNFSSIPPGSFSGLTNLQTISLGGNSNLAPWTIPTELTQSFTLQTFSASNSSLVGSIPDIFNSFPNLQNLRLSYNNLTGSLPNSFRSSEINNLWLNNQLQGLSGTIDVLSSMTQLSQVWLQKNAFTGSIPDLSKCVNLFDLQLWKNQLTGIVPDSLKVLPKLANISLQNNKLQGPWPVFGSGVNVSLGITNSFCKTSSGECDPQVTALLAVAGSIGYPMVLAESWHGNDACSGWTFITCDSQNNVTNVNFIRWGFSGIISPAFSNLTALRNLLLNDNNLTGSIPESLLSLRKLQVLDVSNNNLSGPIPHFPTSVTFKYSGNLLLGKNGTSGGGEAPDSGNPTNPTTPAPSDGPTGTSNGSSVSADVVAGKVVVVMVFVSGVFFVFFVSYKYYVKKRHERLGRVGNDGVPSELQHQSSGDQSGMPVFEGGNVAISIQVIQQVTNNFNEANVLGKGGFGVVYKGELHDGTNIAVKRMRSMATGTRGMNEFQAEIAVLTKVRHRHLVALLGSCINGNERLLVYEYMPQGTLSQHLFEWRELGYPPLSWKQRVTIALDVARGVEYLHSLAQQSFIHRDLKPSNILLGDDMRAKVADFGLVKNALDGKHSLETRVAGTLGYLAPEYAATGRVTTKVDVYAFGVVLIEIITGRKPLDDTMPDEESDLVTWFRKVLINKENLKKAIDETLNPDQQTLESITKVAELASHCSAREPFRRPNMGHAVNVLSPLVEEWKPSGNEDDKGCGSDLHISVPQAPRFFQSF